MEPLISPSRPIVVVGGGPVGSATALLLSRRGFPVTLVDWGESSSKICGEGILPAGWEVMRELGLDSLLRNRSPIEGISYSMAGRDGAWRSLHAQLSQPAFGVQRAHLVEAFSRALDESEVELRRHTKLRDFQFVGQSLELSLQGKDETVSSLKCGFLIAADGLHSKVRRKAGLQSNKAASYKRWGTRCYFRSQEVRPRVEVTLGQGVESYLTPLGDGLFGLAFLWSPHTLGRPLPGEGPTFERLLSFLPSELLERLPSPREDFFGQDKAIGPLQQLVLSPLHPNGRIALVGDAAGYFDALTGEGLCLGLRQARALADCVAESKVGDYPKRYRAIKFRHHLTVGGLLWLLQRPQLRERVFRALETSPRQFQAVLSFAVEEAGFLSLLTPDLGRFLRGLLYQGRTL